MEGRAEAHGTRRIQEQRTSHRGQEKPLPFHMQVHPQRAEPRQIQRRPNKPGHRAGLRVRFRKGLAKYGSGRYLTRDSTGYPVYSGDTLVGYMPCLTSALAWAEAATEVFKVKYQAFNTED